MEGSRRQTFFEELKQRRVVRAVLVYGVVAWVVVQVADTFFPALNLPPWTATLVAALAVLGFPITVALAWVFERGPEGVRKSTESNAAGDGLRIDGRLVSAVGLGILIGLVVVGAGTWLRNRPSADVAETTSEGNALGAGPDSPVARPESDSGVVVLPFVDLTGVDSLAALGAILADYITGQISRNAVGWAVPTQEVRGLAERRPEDVGAVGYFSRSSGARFVVTGTYYRQGPVLLVQAEVTDGRTGELVSSIGPVQGSPSEPMAPVRATANQALIALARILNPRAVRAVEPSAGTPPTYAAYESFVRGLELFDDGEYAQAAESFHRALREDSTYAEALVEASVAELNSGDVQKADSLAQVAQRHRDQMSPFDRAYLDWIQGYFDGDREAIYQAGRRMVALNPRWADCQGPRWTNRLRQAVEECRKRYDFWFEEPFSLAHRWQDLLVSLHLLGEHETEIEYARTARRKHPGDVMAFVFEARALAALGLLEELRVLVDETRTYTSDFDAGWLLREAGLELRVHGHRTPGDEILRESVAWYEQRDSASTGHASSLFAVGDYEAARELCAAWHEENPGSIEGIRDGRGGREPDQETHDHLAMLAAESQHRDCLGLSGSSSAALGDRPAALAVSEELAALEARPYMFGDAAIWRAYIAAELGDRDEAVRLLRAAYEAGAPYGMWMHNPPQIEKLRGHPPYERFMAPKG